MEGFRNAAAAGKHGVRKAKAQGGLKPLWDDQDSESILCC